VEYAGAEYWDRYFAGLREDGSDLDWRGRWTDAVGPLLREAGAKTILDLGCGTGNDALRLVHDGFAVTGLDVSEQAIEEARRKLGPDARLVVGDMALGLPFGDAIFDAVMSNVALHMFPDAVTRRVFAEIQRVLRPGGLFVFHVNAREDRPLRARRRPVARELEPDYVLEETGQTVRFFSREYLFQLLTEWEAVRLESVEIVDEDSGRPFKRLWRGVARRSFQSRHGAPGRSVTSS